MDKQRLTWNEIAEKYPDQWIGLSDVYSIVRCLEYEDNQPLRSMADSDTICKNFKHFKSKFLLRRATLSKMEFYG